MRESRSNRVAVALSGGILRGAAHIGVLQALQKMGITPAAIAGTSAGGLVAGLYGRGMSTDLLEEVTRTFNGRKLLDVSLPMVEVLTAAALVPLYYLHVVKRVSHRIPPGFIVGAKFEKWLQKVVDITPTRHAIPHFVVATDLLSGNAIVFYDELDRPKILPRVEFVPMSDPVIAIRSSCSLPGVLLPRKYHRRLLVDGALRNNLPIDILHHLGFEKVIAVDLHKSQMDDEFTVSYLSILDRMMDIMFDELMELRASTYHPFVIRPNLDGIGRTSWESIPSAIRIGREATEALRDELLAYIQSPTVKK